MTDAPRAPMPRMSRRVVLRSFASAAALAAVSPGVGAGPLRAETSSAARSSLPPFDPYAARTSTGPSSRTVSGVGATLAVPGSPYVVPAAPGWSIVSLLTAGNTARSGYRMAGIPDGLGAFSNGDGTITLLMNHELAAGKSVVRGHGGRGAFVSRWRIDVASLEVLDGADMVTSPADCHLWTGSRWSTAEQLLKIPPPPPPAPAPAATQSASPTSVINGGTSSLKPAKLPPAAKPAAPAKPLPPSRLDVDIDRLCSADAAPISAFWDSAHRVGHNGHILLNGEESESRHGRAFAWVDATRSVYELPAFSIGHYGDPAHPTPEWENLLANPGSGRNTVVVANSDGGPSRIYLYIGRKQRTGSPVEKAGLVGGRLYSLKIGTHDRESRDTTLGGLAKSLLGKGASLPVSVVAADRGTSFLRPEDGAWDPRDANVYFFTTTDRNNTASPDSAPDAAHTAQVGRSRLWAVTFDDVRDIATDGQPTARIQLLIDGTEGGDMFDNITVDRNGIVYLCEDTGDARHNNKIWAYDTKTGALSIFARLDPALFGDVINGVYTAPVPPFIDDKETSGVLDVTELFEDAPWFKAGSTVLLASVQPHFGYDGATETGRLIYEGGQLVMLVKTPGSN